MKHGPSAGMPGLPAASVGGELEGKGGREEGGIEEVGRGGRKKREELRDIIQYWLFNSSVTAQCALAVLESTCSFSSTSRPARPLMICSSSLLVLAGNGGRGTSSYSAVTQHTSPSTTIN